MALRFRPFYPSQPPQAQEEYSRLLLGAAHMGRMFSANRKPFIHYRTIENIFCKSFAAKDISRKDLSVDAIKEKDGIGVKTFLSKGVTSFEKVAEFNDREKYPFNYSDTDALIRQVICYRNDRLEYTIKNFDLENTLYHYVVRDVGKMIICECPLVQIDQKSIHLKKGTRPTHIVRFNDGFNRYSFNTTKSTLYQEFSADNPFRTIEVPSKIDISLVTRTIKELTCCEEANLLVSNEYVILPLYSTREGEVPKHSGLNQWNAGGRKRDYDEVYVPIPRVVHELKPNFFPSRDKKFKLRTLDGREFNAKVCQENNKALMTDPNKDLGQWLLRDTLGLQRGELATMEHLRRKRADTVIIYKIQDDVFQIALHTFGAFEEEYKP